MEPSKSWGQMYCNRSRKGNKPMPINGIVKQVNSSIFEWPEHFTKIDISCKKIVMLEENVKFPPNLIHLDISHNEMTQVPDAILNLDKLKILDLSHNKIKYFDDSPKFYNKIEKLNLSHNDLYGPPYWIWTIFPENLVDLDLSFNIHLTNSLDFEYMEELLQYNTSIRNIKINNCCILKHSLLISTFSKANVIELGSDTPIMYSANRFSEVPCEGLDACCDVETLRLGNTQLYTITSKVDIFTKLVEINLSQNYINSLPEEFCNLYNLETCVLSMNQLLYLPEGIGKLKNLICLLVNSNELCMLPESIVELENLKILDLYDNCLYEIPSNIIRNVHEVDIALNYYDEPDDEAYVESKGKLRLNLPERYNGRKFETEKQSSVYSSSLKDDEEDFSIENEDPVPPNNDLASSPEDWDSDDYWVPRYINRTLSPLHAPWLFYVKKKMEEGNFCPMDMHQISIAEKVKYEKLNSPSILYESDGQFDDYSDDNS